MTMRLRSIDLSTTETHIAGTLLLRDDNPERDIEVDVFPSPKPPGYVISLHHPDKALTDWPVFIVEADRIVRTLVLTAEEAARREAAVRAVITSNRVEGFDDDPDMEVLLWRFARGEYRIDEFQHAVEDLNNADLRQPEQEGPPVGENP